MPAGRPRGRHPQQSTGAPRADTIDAATATELPGRHVHRAGVDLLTEPPDPRFVQAPAASLVTGDLPPVQTGARGLSMVQTDQGCDRLSGVRAAVLAVVAVATGSIAHVDAGAALPSAAVLVVLTGGLALILTPLLRDPPSVRRVVLLIIAGQGVVHVTVTATGDPSSHPILRGTVPTGGSMGGMPGMTGASSGLPVTSIVPGHTELMVAAHLVAAACVGLWIVAGERALWTLVQLALRPVVEAVLALVRDLRACRPISIPSGSPVGGGATIRHLRWEPASGAWSRRGPPSADRPRPHSHHFREEIHHAHPSAPARAP